MTDAERLRQEYERLFESGISEAERAERRRRWVVALREAWDRLTVDERWEMAERREFLHVVGA